MKHFDQSEVSMTYTSNTTGQTIDMSTTMVTIPDPHHRYDVTMERTPIFSGTAYEYVERFGEGQQ